MPGAARSPSSREVRTSRQWDEEPLIAVLEGGHHALEQFDDFEKWLGTWPSSTSRKEGGGNALLKLQWNNGSGKLCGVKICAGEEECRGCGGRRGPCV